MGLEIDIDVFLHNLAATKPPYQCPFEECGKTYKSYQGIAYHLQNQHGHRDGGTSAATGEGSSRKGRRSNAGSSYGSVGGRSPTSSTVTGDYGVSSLTAREALTYAEAQRMIEVEIDGRLHRININEPMTIVRFEKSGPTNGLIGVMEGASISNGLPVDGQVGSDVPSNHPSASTSRGGGAGGRKTHGQKTVKNPSKASKNSKGESKGKSSTPEKPKLPEPSFRLVDDPIEIPDAPNRPTAYYRYIEKSPEELDESVEYDMDEEDVAWLDLINKKRRQDGLPTVSPDTFELLMDRLEKESYFQSQNSPNSAVTPAIDEDAVCCICMDGDCQNSNAILFCDMCNLAVHQECYGVPYIPEGQWLCRRCLHSPSAPVDCVLCPNKGGAFKQTDRGDWAHVVCALWIPEVCFANTVFLEPIDSIERIDKQRWKLLCYICKQRGVGACIQCHRTNCYVAFHVTCAQTAGLYMKIDVPEDGRTGGVHVMKTAYCHTHTPEDGLDGVPALSGVYSTSESKKKGQSTDKKKGGKPPPGKKSSPALSESEFKEKIKKTRKILADKRSAPVPVSIPTIPLDRLNSIAEKINFRRGEKRNEFILRLLGYWTLKRESRNGVPLLRRLQISYHGSRHRLESTSVDTDVIKKWKEELTYYKRLRQDLERARLLVELIRKREKTKRQFLECHQAVIEGHLQPFKNFLLHVLGEMVKKDKEDIFTKPVSLDEVPDYLEFIQNAMDFSTMRNKVENHQYRSFDEFEADFDLIVENCRSYNEGDPYYTGMVNKLRNNCRPILRDGRTRMEEIGFNQVAGIHDPPVDVTLVPPRPMTPLLPIPSPPVGSGTAESLTKEKDLKKQLEEFEDNLEKAKQMKSGGSRTNKLRRLESEIKAVRRQLHRLNPREYPSFGEEECPSSPIRSPARENREVLVLPASPHPVSPKTPIKRKKGVRESSSMALSAKKKSKTLSPSKLPSKRGRHKENQEEEEDENSDTDIYYESPVKKSPLKVSSSKVTPSKPPGKKRGRTTSSSSSGSISRPSSKTSSSSSTSTKVSPSKRRQVPKKTERENDEDEQEETPTKRRKGTSSPLKKTSPTKLASPKRRGRPPKPLKAPPSSLAPPSTGPRGKKKTSSSHNPDHHHSLSSNLSLPLASAQRDSFKVYRSTVHSSDDSEEEEDDRESSAASSSSAEVHSTTTTSSKAEGKKKKKDGRKPKSGRKEKSAVRIPDADSVVEINDLNLEHLDLVWVKRKLQPWTPGMVVDVVLVKKSSPKKDPLLHPPSSIVSGGKAGHHLILLFEGGKSTSWQWIPRKTLRPLGVDEESDSKMKKKGRTSADRKAVSKGYSKAVLFQIKVKGENIIDSDLLSDESSSE